MKFFFYSVDGCIIKMEFFLNGLETKFELNELFRASRYILV